MNLELLNCAAPSSGEAGAANSTVCNKKIQNFDVTSIVESFDNGTYFQTYGEFPCLNENLEKELDSVLLWLEKKFVPCMLYKITCNIQELDKDRYKLVQMKQNIECILRAFKGTKRVEAFHKLTCNECQYDMIFPQGEIYDVSNMLYHDHIEVALAQELCSKKSSKEERVEMKNLPSTSAIQDQEIFVQEKSDNVSIPKKITTTNNPVTIEKNDQISPAKVPLKQEQNCSNCMALIYRTENFKFNFPIRYHPLVEQNLYCVKYSSNVTKVNGFNYPTIQCQTAGISFCLICYSEITIHFSGKMVKEHISGHRHQKRLANSCVLSKFIAYHDYWLKQEPRYQAHQYFFLPATATEFRCTICGDNVPICYHSLERHMNNAKHKNGFFNMCKINGFAHTFLTLQSEVYFLPKTNDAVPVEENDVVDVTTSSSDGVERLITFVRPIGNNEIANTSKNTIAADNLIKSQTKNNLKVFKQNVKPLQETLTIAGVAVNTDNKLNNHVIIKSIKNESGTELTDLLEHRFLPHLEMLVKLNNTTMECESCHIQFIDNIASVKEHIFSNRHNLSSTIVNLKYKYFCEICNSTFHKNDMWQDHIVKQAKHIERCEKISQSRKSKLTEYECNTCKVIIFGDDLSIKRHLNSKPPSLIKNKELALIQKVNLLLKSKEFIEEKCYALVQEARNVLMNQEPVIKCRQALEVALSSTFPHCRAFPFGSRVSGLGNKESDLDVFVDVGGMYEGNKNQDPHNQEKFVILSCREFRKRKEFSHINAVPTARTPIVQVYHMESQLDCDLSFRHGLSVENTKFLRMCMELQPVTQAIILLLKDWAKHFKLYEEHITTYSLAMMVIFYLQLNGYLMSVHDLSHSQDGKLLVIDGWEVVNFESVMDYWRSRINRYSGSVTDILTNFFNYYATFDYVTEVICPLMGRSIKKVLFDDNSNGLNLPMEMVAYVHKINKKNVDVEYFRARRPFCIQDPFDLSHNVAKGCTRATVNKLKMFCSSTSKHLSTIS